jgi:hypothetical protein
MKNISITALISTLLVAFALVFAGCEQGPMEDAGESIDETVDDATN